MNEVDSMMDSDASDVDPEIHDMDMHAVFTQLASGSGKIHKGREEPLCVRFADLQLEEEWGSDYSLCAKCFGREQSRKQDVAGAVSLQPFKIM